jgi:hypothetical protein
MEVRTVRGQGPVVCNLVQRLGFMPDEARWSAIEARWSVAWQRG